MPALWSKMPFVRSDLKYQFYHYSKLAPDREIQV
jgi:hypothetical protein